MSSGPNNKSNGFAESAYLWMSVGQCWMTVGEMGGALRSQLTLFS